MGLQLKESQKRSRNRWKQPGRTYFLIHGTLPTFKRSDAEAMVEDNGGKLVSGVSTKLNYLVVGEDAGSKLEKAKKINTIKIISEDDF